MLNIACVLRSGGEFRPEHVSALKDQVTKYVLIEHRFVCLSDIDVTCKRIPLEHNWPGYWAKMELFRPDIAGDILYLDLDTVVIGDITYMAMFPERFAILEDFYHPLRRASGMMMLPEKSRLEIWGAWIARPAEHMARCDRFDANGIRGDGKFLNDLLSGEAAYLQRLYPGEIVSYKADVRKKANRFERGDGTLSPSAKIVCFHGKPRPWADELKNIAWIPDYAGTAARVAA